MWRVLPVIWKIRCWSCTKTLNPKSYEKCLEVWGNASLASLKTPPLNPQSPMDELGLNILKSLPLKLPLFGFQQHLTATPPSLVKSSSVQTPPRGTPLNAKQESHRKLHTVSDELPHRQTGSPHQQHLIPHLRQAHHQHLGGVDIVHMQVHPRLQGCTAHALGLDLSEFA